MINTRRNLIRIWLLGAVLLQAVGSVAQPRDQGWLKSSCIIGSDLKSDRKKTGLEQRHEI